MTIEERADAYIGHPKEIDEFTFILYRMENINVLLFLLIPKLFCRFAS